MFVYLYNDDIDQTVFAIAVEQLQVRVECEERSNHSIRVMSKAHLEERFALDSKNA